MSNIGKARADSQSRPKGRREYQFKSFDFMSSAACRNFALSITGAWPKSRELSCEVSLVKTQRSRNKVFAKEKDKPDL